MKTKKNVEVTFPNGQKRSYDEDTTALQVAESLSQGLARKTLAVQWNGETQSPCLPLSGKGTLKLLTWDDDEGKRTFWHSSAHLMAEALEKMYPGIKLGIGPPIAQGFYYDVDFGEKDFSPQDIPKLEHTMLTLARQKNTYLCRPVSKKEAATHYRTVGNEYKLELIEGLEDGTITFYTQGTFTDLCKGPHLPHTGHIKAVKILNVAGAYWRGNEKNKQLTRLYGISFPKETALKDYLKLLEEAKKRDHRVLGKRLGLFTFSEKVGLGLPLWLPKGAQLRETLEDFLKKAQQKAGYQPVITPHIAQKKLYEVSGHDEKYGTDSFQPILTPQKEVFVLKPMNCPHHCEIYKSEPRSYKDLPLRLAEFGTVYRYEQSGELHGLTRVRGFTQDDAHIFCTPQQIRTEFAKVIDLVLYVFNTLGFDHYQIQVSVRDKNNTQKYVGEDKDWAQAEADILSVTQDKDLDTKVVEGEAAFYGPKLDFMVKDALGRSWQLGTIQLDYQLPARFQLEYTGQDNQKHQPVMIHRAPFGSMERFVAVLIEHYKGELPFWLAPTQVIILPISDKVRDYAQTLRQGLEKEEFRVAWDGRDEKIGKKIREAELSKVPYMAVIGEKEAQDNTVSLRRHGQGQVGTFQHKELYLWLHKQRKVKGFS